MRFCARDRVADEEGPHLDDVLARLPRLSHRLNDVRERVEVFSYEPDDEIVVVRVEAVRHEPHVVREVFCPIGATDDRVLAEDRSLLAWLELRERARTAERGPDGPRVERVLDRRLPSIDEPEL